MAVRSEHRGSARRLVAELLDENALARRAREMHSTQQALRVAAFREHLDGLDAHRDNAAAAALAHLGRWRAALDEDAAAVITPTTATVRRDLDARISLLTGASAADLETAGWSAMTDLVIEAVNGWRATWSTRLTETAVEATRRQARLREVLDAAARDQADQPNTDPMGDRLTALAEQLDHLLHKS